MVLVLKDLMKKAREKGVEKADAHFPSATSLHRPWQQESVLFNHPKLDNKIDNELEINKENNQETIKEHFGNTSGTNRGQSENIQGTYREQLGNTLEIKTDNKLDINKIKLELLRLSGIQEKLFFYSLDSCLTREDGTTGFILTKKMAETLQCSYETAKISLKRLIKKGLINRLKGKTSRGGFIILKIPHTVKTLALQFKKPLHLENKLESGLENKSETQVFHYNNSNKTITIGDGWDEIDILALEHVGFKKNHLLQLKNFNTPEIVQESINHFAFALESNKKVQAYETPLNVLIGVLKRGEAWIEGNYISPHERVLKKRVEAAKAEQERLTKLHTELLEAELSVWLSKLSEIQINEILFVKKGMPREVALKLHFKEMHWPEIKKALSRY